MKTLHIIAGPIIHDSFPNVFIDRVKNFMTVIAEVDNTPFQDFIDGFQRDHNPESELETWEKIAGTYQWAIVGTPGLTKEQKKDVFTVILGLSMGTKDFNNLKNLSKELVEGIESQFSR